MVCLGGASQRACCGESPTETGQLTQSGQDGGRAASRHRFHHPSIARAPGSYRAALTDTIKALVTLVTGGVLFAGFSGRAAVLHNIEAYTAFCGYVTTREFGCGLHGSVKSLTSYRQ